MQTNLASPPSATAFWAGGDARWRLAGVLLALAATALVTTLPAALLSLALAAATALAARAPLRLWLDRLPGVAVFIVLLLVTVPLTAPGPRWGPFSHAGLAFAGLLAVKIVAALVWSLLLFAAGPFERLTKAAQGLGLPNRAAHLLSLTHRYVLLLHDQLGQLRIALRLRGFRNRPNRRSWRTVGQVAGTLLVRSHDRAERIGQALACRGYDGRPRTLTSFRTRPADVAWGLGLGVAAVGLLVLDFLGRPV